MPVPCAAPRPAATAPATPATPVDPPVVDVGEVLARCEKLPAPPGLTLEILRQADDPRTTVGSLARAIGRDPGLASALVRMANSSLFSPASEISSIERAVVMLGLRSVTLLALSLSVGSLLPDGAGSTPGAAAVRRRSLVNAVLSRQLLPARVAHLADEVFLVGLVGHLGRLGLAEACPDAFAELLASGGGWSRPEDERAVVGLSGDELTADMLARWGLPDRLVQAVRHRRSEPGAAPAPLEPVLGALRLGLLAEDVLCGDEPGPALHRLRQGAEAHLGMGADQLDRLLLDAEPLLAEAAALLRVDLPAGTSHGEVLSRAMLQIAALSADTAAELSVGRRRTAELTDENHRLSIEIRVDPLTGIANRRTLGEFLDAQLAAPSTGGRADALGVLIVDLDHFKVLNDTYGHTVGDHVLQAVAAVLSHNTRGDDLAARFGGEEFVVVLSRTTPTGVARAANRLRRAIARVQVPCRGEVLRITASIGGASVSRPSGPHAARALIDRADAKLYEAKRAGRDACRVDTDPA